VVEAQPSPRPVEAVASYAYPALVGRLGETIEDVVSHRLRRPSGG
jgi:hypothetical protein